MTIQAYKQRLLALEAQLSRRAARERTEAREQIVDSPRDAADNSVADEGASEEFTAAELDANVLQDIHDALRRIDDGTFGRCAVDGEPIEPKRLEAMPWARWCLKHQTQLESAAGARTPSL